MKEYLALNCIFLLPIILLDIILSTRLLRNKKFWYFHIIVVILTIITDSFFSGRPIVLYDNQFNINFYIIHTPIENFFFGFNLLTLNLILFEFSNRKNET